MRLATIATDQGPAVAVVRDGTVIRLATELDLGSMRDICAQGRPAMDRIRAWIDRDPSPRSARQSRIRERSTRSGSTTRRATGLTRIDRSGR
jgi:hypothetical protein